MTNSLPTDGSISASQTIESKYDGLSIYVIDLKTLIKQIGELEPPQVAMLGYVDDNDDIQALDKAAIKLLIADELLELGIALDNTAKDWNIEGAGITVLLERLRKDVDSRIEEFMP